MKKIWLSALLFPSMVSAAGIDISPAKIDLETHKDQTAEQVITVANPTADVQVFEVYADDFKNLFTFTPASFTLEAGERKTVTLSFDGKSTDSALLSTNISVLATPLADARFNANTGVKIPTTVRISEGGNSSNWVNKDLIFFGTLGLVLLYLIFRLIKAKQDHNI
ncbi:MAG: hypothetical protein HYW51_04030 [Candidatus Doudnabacteria bacterium]|nr:hypothetical protein [Candidatus Doudnabacteria bacterium]